LILIVFGISHAQSLRASSPKYGQRYSVSLRFGELERKYQVLVPSSYNGSQALPLVVALHGSTGSGEDFLEEGNWGITAEKYGFIVLAPDGLPLNTNLPAVSAANPRLWNTGQLSHIYSRTKIDDVSQIIAMVDDVATRWQIDLRRVYAVGYSNGGSMAFRLAAERADRFAAIASISGINWVDNPHPSRSTPTLLLNGSLDPLVPPHGGIKILPWQISPTPPVHKSMSKWAVVNGCSPEPTITGEIPEHHITVEDYPGGASGGTVRLMTIKGHGHAWPGGNNGLRPERLLGPDTSRFDATSAAWAFVSQWSL
jgi:polyhydroxybutyrate depolymerase